MAVSHIMDNAQLRVMKKKKNKKITSLDKKNKKNKNFCHLGKRTLDNDKKCQGKEKKDIKTGK